MKLGPETKRDKRNKIMPKKLTMMSCQQIMNLLLFFQFIADLEQPRSWIPDAWSVILTFSLRRTFCLTKTENITKKSFTQLSKMLFFQK